MDPMAKRKWGGGEGGVMGRGRLEVQNVAKIHQLLNWRTVEKLHKSTKHFVTNQQQQQQQQQQLQQQTNKQTTTTTSRHALHSIGANPKIKTRLKMYPQKWNRIKLG